ELVLEGVDLVLEHRAVEQEAMAEDHRRFGAARVLVVEVLTVDVGKGHGRCLPGSVRVRAGLAVLRKPKPGCTVEPGTCCPKGYRCLRGPCARRDMVGDGWQRRREAADPVGHRRDAAAGWERGRHRVRGG